MRLPVTQGAYNLLEEKWIPVHYGNGKTDRVGICQALTDARKIRQIAASNPMDRVSLLRFLLAVLMWCKEDAKSSLAALEEKGADIPENWLDKLKENENKAKFNLLGDGGRFYQDESLKCKKSRPIGDLLVEFPTETKIAHFRHVRDKEYGLCPACCAMGIVRFCAFANYAGKGYTSGVNGPAPAYAVMHGSTLLQTLCFNCPLDAKLHRQPPWLCDMQPKAAELDAVTVFAWRSRRLWLNDPWARVIAPRG
jgi:CRISPR type I-E-associated protein CasA/Cse1